mgnify:CR=1 FL=1
MTRYSIGLLFLLCCSSPKEGQETTASTEKKPLLTSLLNVSFYEPEWSPTQKAKLDSNLTVAIKNFESDPSEGNYIWYGRRDRGHRFISIRKFDGAIADFEKAVDLMKGKLIENEPDGQPNKLNIPLSNTQFNVWYHLGLAYYLKGDFMKAENAYKQCILVSNNNDLLIATADWLYMTLRRENKIKEAEELLNSISESLVIIENDSYYQRLMLYKGKQKVDELLNPDPQSEDYDLALATQGYGVANWYLYSGDTARANEIFTKIVGGKHFSSFGFIAAEAELVRMK